MVQLNDVLWLNPEHVVSLVEQRGLVRVAMIDGTVHEFTGVPAARIAAKLNGPAEARPTPPKITPSTVYPERNPR